MIKWGLLKNHFHFPGGMHLVPGGIPDAGMQVNISHVTVVRISGYLVFQRTIRADAPCVYRVDKEMVKFYYYTDIRKVQVAGILSIPKKIQLNC